MGRFNTKSRLLVFLVLLTFSVPISMGCFESPLESNNQEQIELGDSTPVDTGTVVDTGDTSDPNDPPAQNTASVLTRNEDEVNSNPLFDLLNSVVRLVFRILGGTVSMLDMTLEIPPMSLDRNTSITVDVPDPNLYIYDFGPDGTQFKIPATITIEYDYADLSGRDESKIRLAWWDESNQVWVDMPCTVDASKKTVTGSISHFSSYGLISD